MDNPELETRLRALEDFKTKVDTGQRWLVCSASVIGTIIIILTSIWTAVHVK